MVVNKNKLSVTSVSNLFFTTKSHNCPPTRTGRSSSHHAPPSVAFASNHGPRSRHLRVRLGNVREQDGLDRYSVVTNSLVTDRNTRDMTLVVELSLGNTVEIHGRPDGICNDIVIEHKRRSRGLLHYVPMHEKVQCHMYMKMLGFGTAHLVETFANAMHIHVVPFDDSVWDKILSKILRWNSASDFNTMMDIRDQWRNVSPRALNNSEPSENRRSDEQTFF